MTENEKYLYDHFLISIRSGFESLEDIIANAIEAVEDEGWEREIPETWIRKTITAEYKKNIEASQLWGKDTDPEKLLNVFDSLCKSKILALHNIGYDTSEAIYDAMQIWQELEDEGIEPTGYCYYHGQDLERVIESSELGIGFHGKEEKNEKEAILIGNQVKAALEKAGFEVKWNHTAKEKITVVNFEWKNIFTSNEEIAAKWGVEKIFQLME